MKQQYPPGWVESLLDFLLKDRFADETIGDLIEWYQLKQHTYSSFTLWWYFTLSILKALKFYKLKKIQDLLILLSDIMMLNNNIKIGIRSLVQNRFFTLINLVGLSVSFISFLLIYAYVSYETSYDNFHPESEQIYRVINYDVKTGYRGRPTSTPLGRTLKEYWSDVATFARFGQDPVYLNASGSKYYEEHFYWSDSEIFTVFPLPFLYGDAHTALSTPNGLVLTQEKSEKYFGKGVNPVGQMIPVKVYDSDTDLLMRVDGVLKAIPANSDLPFEILGSMDNALDLYSRFNDMWGFLWLHTYARIPNDTDLNRITESIPEIMHEKRGNRWMESNGYEFQPLSRVHLYSADVRASLTSGNINYVITFVIIGVFILLIASINYLNLMGARVSKRSGEVGVRKVLGASRRQLMAQFLTESNLTIFISLLLALTTAVLAFPLFADFIDKPLSLSLLLNGQTLLFLILLGLFCGTMSGIYPATLLVRMNGQLAPAQHSRVHRRNAFQRLLVVFQFAISVFLITSTLVIFRQVDFMTHVDLGFNDQRLMTVKVEDRKLQDKIKLIAQEMQDLSGVAAATISGESLPSQMNNTWDIQWEGLPTEERKLIELVSVGVDFFEILDISIIAGEGFSSMYENDSANYIVLNEAAAEMIGRQDLLRKKVTIGGMERTIIGVAQNHHYQSLQSVVSPVAFLVTTPGTRISPDNVIVRLGTDNTIETISQMDEVWKSFSTSEYFSFRFVDEAYGQTYDGEYQFLNLFTVFAILSILISCMGLYGIVLFTTDAKSKEISIRKVLGSSVSQIVLLISRKFVLLVVLGFILGTPVAIYFANDWLSNFSYSISIGYWTLLLAALLVLIMAILTVGINTFKAAIANPADHLRNE